MNKLLLRSVMALHGDTNKSLAEFLGISETSIINKMNEKGTEFRKCEIGAIKKRYFLTDEQVVQIFFS